jgi:hypothetical protein
MNCLPAVQKLLGKIVPSQDACIADELPACISGEALHNSASLDESVRTCSGNASNEMRPNEE